MKPTLTFTGVKRLDRRLMLLAKRDARRIGRKAGRRGVATLKKGISEEAPMGATKRLKRSIGSRFRKKRRSNVIEAKAGVNVAKKAGKQAPHGHFVAMETGFVDRASRKRGRDAFNEMKRTVAEEIRKLR